MTSTKRHDTARARRRGRERRVNTKKEECRSQAFMPGKRRVAGERDTQKKREVQPSKNESLQMKKAKIDKNNRCQGVRGKVQGDEAKGNIVGETK